MSTPRRHGKTPIITVAHKAHSRDYQYHILPGVLTSEQLTGALWQAELFGSTKIYVRISGRNSLELLKKDSSEDNKGISMRWLTSNGMKTAEIVEGSWHTLNNLAERQTSADRNDSLQKLKRNIIT